MRNIVKSIDLYQVLLVEPAKAEEPTLLKRIANTNFPTLPPLVKSNRAEEEVEMRKKTVNITVPSPAPLVKSNRARRILESTKTRANHLLQATSLKKRRAGETKELFQMTANPTSQPMRTHSLQTFK